MVLYFLQGAALALPTVLTPSPFKLYVIAQALQHGFRRTLPAIFAPLITDGPIIAAVLLVLTQTPAWFLHLLRLGGGLFLLYLAARLLFSLRLGAPRFQPAEQVVRQNLLQAVVVNFLNPNPYLFWGLVAGPIMMQGLQQAVGVGLSFVLGFYVVFIGGLFTLILLFASAGRLNPQVTRLLLALAALAMVAIGGSQVYQAVGALVG